MEEQLRNVHHTDWILWVLISGSVLLLAAKLYNPVRFRQFLILPFSAKRTEIEDTFNPAVGRGLFDISLSLVSYLLMALAIFLVLHPYQGKVPVLNDWGMYLRLLFVLILFFLVKNLAGLFVGWVFGKSEEIASAQNINLAYRAWFSVYLLPLVAVMVFYLPAYRVGYFLVWFCLCGGYFFALQFSLFKLWKIGVKPYYKFFYLCALEITPLLFLVGWLKSLG